MTTNQSSETAGLYWAYRFLAALLAMVGLNLLTLARTWKAYHTDMMEQIGFPFAFRERGGFSGVDAWHYEFLLIDILIALALAYGFAHAFKEGFVATFHKLRKLGLENKT
ncbi:MAG: hypothetical protein P8M30_18715 [Planctomycetaceae bacterium]|nr:hypothetical protein [bacterium]MDC0308597.1 hypothetical protein [Planctomycetaceae bacterium]MDG2391345.1 hypothetical protein [Planctomycetaceae bacterium]